MKKKDILESEYTLKKFFQSLKQTIPYFGMYQEWISLLDPSDQEILAYALEKSFKNISSDEIQKTNKVLVKSIIEDIFLSLSNDEILRIYSLYLNQEMQAVSKSNPNILNVLRSLSSEELVLFHKVFYSDARKNINNENEIHSKRFIKYIINNDKEFHLFNAKYLTHKYSDLTSLIYKLKSISLIDELMITSFPEMFDVETNNIINLYNLNNNENIIQIEEHCISLTTLGLEIILLINNALNLES